jgi:hypothetical protein
VVCVSGSQSSGPRPEEDMVINFSCPSCGKAYQLPQSVAGKKVPCNQCKSPMLVPFKSVVTDTASSGSNTTSAQPVTAGTPSDKRKLWMLTAGGVVAVIGILLCVKYIPKSRPLITQNESETTADGIPAIDPVDDELPRVDYPAEQLTTKLPTKQNKEEPAQESPVAEPEQKIEDDLVEEDKIAGSIAAPPQEPATVSAEEPPAMVADDPVSATDEETEKIAVEIEERVREAGGIKGEIEIGLLWHDFNDLDLHVVEPDGNRIYYGRKNSRRSDGALDVDRNAGCGHLTSRPIEHIVWSSTELPRGEYKILVHFFERCHSRKPSSDYTVQLKIGDDIQTFKGSIGIVDQYQHIFTFSVPIVPPLPTVPVRNPNTGLIEIEKRFFNKPKVTSTVRPSLFESTTALRKEFPFQGIKLALNDPIKAAEFDPSAVFAPTIGSNGSPITWGDDLKISPSTSQTVWLIGKAGSPPVGAIKYLSDKEIMIGWRVEYKASGAPIVDSRIENQVRSLVVQLNKAADPFAAKFAYLGWWSPTAKWFIRPPNSNSGMETIFGSITQLNESFDKACTEHQAMCDPTTWKIALTDIQKGIKTDGRVVNFYSQTRPQLNFGEQSSVVNPNYAKLHFAPIPHPTGSDAGIGFELQTQGIYVNDKFSQFTRLRTVFEITATRDTAHYSFEIPVYRVSPVVRP